MKRILAILLVCFMVLGLFACTSTQPATQDNAATTDETAATQAPAAENLTTDVARKEITFWFWGAATPYQETMMNGCIPYSV